MNKDKMDDNFFDTMALIADDVFLLSEEEVDAELRELGIDPDVVAKTSKILVGKSIMKSTSARLKSQNEMHVVSDASNVIEFSPSGAKAKLAEIISRDPNAFPELTMAARKGTSISDADAQSQIEDLLAVGAITIDDLK